MYLRSTNVYFKCWDGCGHFTFENGGRGFSTEENLKKAFLNEYAIDYAI